MLIKIFGLVLPAVSQICSLIFFPSISIVRILKSMPIVVMNEGVNWSSLNRRRRQDLPTPFFDMLAWWCIWKESRKFYPAFNHGLSLTTISDKEQFNKVIVISICRHGYRECGRVSFGLERTPVTELLVVVGVGVSDAVDSIIQLRVERVRLSVFGLVGN